MPGERSCLDETRDYSTVSKHLCTDLVFKVFDVILIRIVYNYLGGKRQGKRSRVCIFSSKYKCTLLSIKLKRYLLVSTTRHFATFDFTYLGSIHERSVTILISQIKMLLQKVCRSIRNEDGRFTFRQLLIFRHFITGTNRERERNLFFELYNKHIILYVTTYSSL